MNCHRWPSSLPLLGRRSDSERKEKTMKKKKAPKPESEHLPLDDVSDDQQAIEDSLEREAPNERRDQLSPEYGNVTTQWTTPEETRFEPDGKEDYSESQSEFRARGENIQGSLQRQQEEEAHREPAVEPPGVSTQVRNRESDPQGSELDGTEE
jgi:hypothetical protein